MALADLVVVMNDGRIEQAAPPREVFERPATAFVARFIGGHNVISGRVAAARTARCAATHGGGASRRRPARRPIESRPATAPVDATAGARLGVTGARVEYLGSTVQLGVDVAGHREFTGVVAEAAFFDAPDRRRRRGRRWTGATSRTCIVARPRLNVERNTGEE